MDPENSNTFVKFEEAWRRARTEKVINEYESIADQLTLEELRLVTGFLSRFFDEIMEATGGDFLTVGTMTEIPHAELAAVKRFLDLGGAELWRIVAPNTILLLDEEDLTITIVLETDW